MRNLDYSLLYKKIVIETKDFVHNSGYRKILLGLSGGMDSALVATIAAEALEANNVFSYMLSTKFTSKASFDDAQALAKNLGIHYEIIDIQPIIDQAISSLIPIFLDSKNPSNLYAENLQSRIRSVILMAISNKTDALLLNTSNKSEILSGYFTLYGDTCGALSVIGDLYKTEVYELAKLINKNQEIIPENIILKAPSAELKENQFDSDSLPDYPILDPILEKIQNNMTLENNAVNNKILELYNKAKFKQKYLPEVIKVL